MPTSVGYRGDIIVDTTYTLTFIGAWSLDIERETNQGKPPITASSTGAKPVTVGGLNISGSLDGIVMAGADTQRSYVMGKLKSGAKVTLDLKQADAAAFALTGVLITKGSWQTDSQDGSTVAFEFTADDYTYDDDAVTTGTQ